MNANALHYLGGASEVVEHLLRVLHENRESHCDKWYENPFAVWYPRESDTDILLSIINPPLVARNVWVVPASVVSVPACTNCCTLKSPTMM